MKRINVNVPKASPLTSERIQLYSVLSTYGLSTSFNIKQQQHAPHNAPVNQANQYNTAYPKFTLLETNIANVTAGLTCAPENGPAKQTEAKKNKAKNSSEPYEHIILNIFQ